MITNRPVVFRPGTPERASLAAELADMYTGGSTLRDITHATGRSFGSVRNLILESGASLRPRGGYGRRGVTR